jgi:hypothetical protein
MKSMFAASVSLKSQKFRGVLAAAIALAAAIVPAGQAAAVSSQVRFACAGDYLTHCSSFAPESAETRRCMRAIGHKLSQGCINALVASGEVSKAEVARRSASQR